MSETSHEDEHHHDERLRPKTPDEHSGNQDLQAMLHRRQEAEEKLQERQEEAGRRDAADRGEGAEAEDSSLEDGTDADSGTDAGDPSRGD